MRQTIKILGQLFFLLIAQITFGQKQEQYFYNAKWKECSLYDAVYYRIVNFDSTGKPIGKIKDYFITGEIQSEQEGATYVDKSDDSKSKFFGKSTGYYKSGKKNFENLRDQSGQQISNIHWYENGNIKLKETYTYKNGKRSGSSSVYYENGKLKNSAEYDNGKLVDKYYLDCDEFGKCQKVFYEGFKTLNNENDWPIINDKEDFSSKIVETKGLRMETKTTKGFFQLMHLPIDVNGNFSIETIINHEFGDENSGEGLVYGFKDWDNYFYFIISSNGYFKIGSKSEGINLDFEKWQTSSYINKNFGRNLIKVNKIKDKVYFSINGQLVSSQDYYQFRGNLIGFEIQSGIKQVLFEQLIVREDAEANEQASNSMPSSDWKSSGSGFFIDGKGYILTNYHVIDEASEIEVDLIQKGQKKSFKAKIISSDKLNDMAVIKIDDNNFSPYYSLPYNFKTTISDVGTNVFALGYPMHSILGDEIKFTDGKISSKSGFQGDVTKYQITVPVQPGNSGCPLFDYDGNLVGIVNSKVMAAENVSYAIKSIYAKSFIDVLQDKITVPTNNTLELKPLTEKIKALSDYVVLIKIK